MAIFSSLYQNPPCQCFLYTVHTAPKRKNVSVSFILQHHHMKSENKKTSSAHCWGGPFCSPTVCDDGVLWVDPSLRSKGSESSLWCHMTGYARASRCHMLPALSPVCRGTGASAAAQQDSTMTSWRARASRVTRPAPPVQVRVCGHALQANVYLIKC